MSDTPTATTIHIQEHEGRIEIHAQDKSVMIPSDLEAIRADFQGKAVLVSGKAPNWFYAHAAYKAVSGGGAEISVIQLPTTEIPVYRLADSPASAPVPRWAQIEIDEDNHCTISLITTANRKEDPGILDSGAFAFPEGVNSLTLTGNGANWMYSYLGAIAAAAGIKKVIYDAPKESGYISIGADAVGEILPRPGQQGDAGLVVGILGDPHSGKSVFAKFLAGLVAREFPSSWNYDCDHASPTPNWFTEAARQGREPEFIPIRDGQKRKWSPEMEARVASEIRNLKANSALTIADLPGGNHKASPPQRVPAGREVILREADAFVILGREGEPHILPAWRAELEKHGLADRIIAEIISASPELPLTLDLRQEAGLLAGTASGLDRKCDLFASLRKISAGENLLVRHLRAWKAARAAREATAFSFLTKPGGNCYGAAVLTRQGGVFRSGQYSSFNHSTNIHAEQGALLRATMAGEPDVLVLALAKSKGSDAARPCGVCRQVMLEHAQRTGRDFDVAMLGGSGRCEISRALELLPLAWSKDRARAKASARPAPAAPVPRGADVPLRVGDQALWPHEGVNYLGIVWEPLAEENGGGVFLKLKYVEGADGLWEKLPHSFSEPMLYERFLGSSLNPRSLRFGGSVACVPLREIARYCPLVTAEGFLPDALAAILDEAGIAPESLLRTGSSATDMNADASDLDLVCTLDAGRISLLREAVARGIEAGSVSIPESSQTWKLLAAQFPGGRAGILRERRFCETFAIGDSQIVLIFDAPGDPGFLLGAGAGHPVRHVVSGTVEAAGGCAYKRSRFVVAGPTGRGTQVVSYLKTANLLKDGDRVAARGWLVPNADREGENLLLQISAATDTLLWQGM
jgi:cytidine deaminase